MNFTILGGRRFVLAVGAGMVTTLLQWFGKLDPAGAAYSAVVIATVAAYITGNAVENRDNAKFKTPAGPLDQ